MPATTTTLASLLQERYLPRLRGQFYKQTPVYSRLVKKAEDHDFSGKRCVIGAHHGRNEAVGARAESASMPTAQAQQIAQMFTTVKYVYGKIKITGPTIAASRKSPGAFASALNLEMKGVKETLLFEVARMFVFGDGTGKLAQVNGAVTAGTDVVVDNPGVTHLRVGMVIDIYNGSTLQGNSVEITAINRATNTITVSAAVTVSDNAWVYHEDAKDVEPMGLKGIIDDGTFVATFQNLARATHTWLQANVLGNSGTNRALSIRLMDDLCLEAEKNGGGGHPSAIYGRHVQAQNYADLVRQDRRYSPKEMTLDGGFRAIEVTHPGGTVPLIMDRMVPANTLFAPDESKLGIWELEAPTFMDQDGAILQRALDGSDAYEATILTYTELGAENCNSSSVLRDLSE